MDKFIWLNTTSGKSYINLAEVSVICFNEYDDECDIHLKSGTIFTTTSVRGDSFFNTHEDYLFSMETINTPEMAV